MDAKDITAETTECPICHEYYNDPKILPCAHILCRNCLLAWMKKTSHALCPLCRSSIVDPQGFSSDKIEDFVDCLPTDHAMSAMVEGVKIFNQDHVCHVHGDVIAASLCLHCNVMMCQGCVEVHRKLQITSSHRVESIQTLTLECLAKSRQEPCSVHPDKISELFCSSHNVLICQLCATSKHRTCPEVTNLQEMYEKYKRSLSELKAKLIPTISALSQAMANIEEHILKSEQSVLAAFAKIDESCDSILSFVENCRKRLKKLVQEADYKIKATILEQKSALSERRGRLTAHMYLIQRVQQMAHGSCLVAMVPKLENRIVKLDLDTSITEETGQSLKRVALTIDQEAIVRMTRELEKLGDVVISCPSSQEQITNETNKIENIKPTHVNQVIRPAGDCETGNRHSQESIINDTKKGRFGSCGVLNEGTKAPGFYASLLNFGKKVKKTKKATRIPVDEYEALEYMKGPELRTLVRSARTDGSFVSVTAMSTADLNEINKLMSQMRSEEMSLDRVEMDKIVKMETSINAVDEDVEAFIKPLPDKQTVVIYAFDYSNLNRAVHYIKVRIQRLQTTPDAGRKKILKKIASYEADDRNSENKSAKSSSLVTKNDIQVSVYKANITQLTVDAIINAANENLAHGGGIALAIARAAGHVIEIEGDEYKKAHGNLKVTDVVPTSSGNLPCKKVLHAVGPRWKDYQDKNLCQQHLAQTVFNCFFMAHELHVTSLAMSSISSGIFGVPKDICATMYLAAIQRFDYEYGPITTLRHIHFVDISDDMLAIIQDTFTEKWDITVNPPKCQRSRTDTYGSEWDWDERALCSPLEMKEKGSRLHSSLSRVTRDETRDRRHDVEPLNKKYFPQQSDIHQFDGASLREKGTAQYRLNYPDRHTTTKMLTGRLSNNNSAKDNPLREIDQTYGPIRSRSGQSRELDDRNGSVSTYVSRNVYNQTERYNSPNTQSSNHVHGIRELCNSSNVQSSSYMHDGNRRYNSATNDTQDRNRGYNSTSGQMSNKYHQKTGESSSSGTAV